MKDMSGGQKVCMTGTQFIEGTLADGNAIEHKMAGCSVPCTIWVDPAAGDTVMVQMRGKAGVTPVNWTPGGVTAAANQVLKGPVYSLIFQRTAGSGTTSAYGVTE